MARIINWITAAVLLAALCAPLASWIVADRLPSLATPRAGSVFDSGAARREAIASSLIGDSPYGRMLVGLKNRFDYYDLGVINTPTLISGEWPWIFYKPEFNAGRCVPEKEVRAVLAQVEALRLLAEGAGIRLVVSISPDKPVVHPEKLGPRAAILAGCKLKSAAAWRAWARDHGSSLLDHGAALAGPARAGIQTFDATDTHWNPLGFAYALRQLAERLAGKELPDPYRRDLPAVPVPTGILGDMLAIGDPELQPQLLPGWLAESREILAPDLPGAVVIHDSFYDRYRELLQLLFPDATLFNVNSGPWRAMLQAIRARPPILIVNAVERSMFQRLALKGIFGAEGILTRALLEANREASSRCVFADGDGPALEMAGLVPGKEPGLLVSTTRTPSIALTLPVSAAPICLRIAFDRNAGEHGLLFLPPPPGYPDGTAIPLASFPPGPIQLVLPASLSGQTIRIRPLSAVGRRIANLTVATGAAP